MSRWKADEVVRYIFYISISFFILGMIFFFFLLSYSYCPATMLSRRRLPFFRASHDIITQTSVLCAFIIASQFTSSPWIQSWMKNWIYFSIHYTLEFEKLFLRHVLHIQKTTQTQMNFHTTHPHLGHIYKYWNGNRIPKTVELLIKKMCIS